MNEKNLYISDYTINKNIMKTIVDPQRVKEFPEFLSMVKTKKNGKKLQRMYVNCTRLEQLNPGKNDPA